MFLLLALKVDFKAVEKMIFFDNKSSFEFLKLGVGQTIAEMEAEIATR